MQRAGADTGLAKEFKDIFELGGVPSFNEFYYFGIFLWKAIYKGFYKPWHLIPAPTIQDVHHKRNMAFLNLSKAISSELAGIVWTDQADVCVTTENLGENEEDVLARFVCKVLKENNFSVKMREAIEQAAALGGEALKVWYEERRDAEGNVIPDSGRIKVGYCMADQFVPVSWDNAKIDEGVFISRIAKGAYYYTKLEWHKWDGLTYVISNELFRADRKGMNGEDQDILGFRYPLDTIYPFLDEETALKGLEASLFSYFRTPTANNVDDNSPLGVSIYANAMETLHALDICFDSFVREFRLGKKRIIVPARMIRQVVDPVSGEQVRYFDATDETYEALSTDDPDSLKIQDNSVSLRVEEHVQAMNALLNILCLQTGLSAGTFSFDAKSGIKTATEVVSENSKTYKTVKNFQDQIIPAIERLVRNIIAIACLYDLQFEGQSIQKWADRGFEVSVTMDDGITQDRQTNINEGVLLMNSKVLSRKTFMMDKKYGQGLTEEAADKELAQIAQEQRIDTNVLDKVMFDTAE